LRSNLNNVEIKIELDFRRDVFSAFDALAGEPPALRHNYLIFFYEVFNMEIAILVVFLALLGGAAFLALLIWFVFRRRKTRVQKRGFVKRSENTAYAASSDIDDDDDVSDSTYFENSNWSEGETENAPNLTESEEYTRTDYSFGDSGASADSSSSYDSSSSSDSGSSDGGSSSSSD
jgi:uncharacterized membrane protein YgcG